MGSIVAIVGRPNVGKSTLYNRLVGSRDAITDDISGVTRDRKYGTCSWNGKKFTIVDTGGFVQGSEDVFEAAIRDQVQVAIEEAAVILFMVDVKTGITDLDESVARMLRKTTKPVFVIANKADNHTNLLDANEFYGLGFEEVFSLAAISGSGTGELLDAITDKLEVEEEEEIRMPRFAIVGRPNVGKSSFTNALLGTERNIVTPIAGTTRDSNHSVYNKFGHEFMLIDTAGMRKKSKVEEDLEFYSVMRSVKAIEECDVCILIVDATQGIESQDINILRLAQSRHKGIVILLNKWDLVPKETNTARDMEKEIKHKISPFTDVPIVFISATEKLRIMQAIEKAIEVHNNRNQQIKTNVLNELMLPIIESIPPPSIKGRLAKIKYVTQLPTRYPTFAFFVNNPNYVKDNYKQFLENQLRKHFNFSGVTIDIFFREK